MRGLLVALLAGVFCCTPLAAQRQGPLVIRDKPPRPRRTPLPPTSTVETRADEPRPVLKERNSGACPEGYVPRPTLTRREEDDRPRMKRRGEEPEQAAAEPEPEETVECIWVGVEEARVVVAEESFLSQARRKVFEFSRTLPNFICEQLTSRYISYSNPPKWELQDRVSAEVIYEDGKESYRNFKRNGKLLKTRTPDDTGAWSSGEFASLMQGVFHPGTEAEFTDQGETEINGKQARLYDFAVPASRSKWRVMFEEIALHPAYSGSVWFDPGTHRVLRIEMVAENLPSNFGLDAVEMSVEYDTFRIGGTGHLLTSRAVNLGCQRGSRICSKNDIEFRGFRKFGAESTIVLDSPVEYEEQPRK